MLVVYSTPDDGSRYIGMAWEWTVYCVKGVWRCPGKDIQNIVPRFFLFLKVPFEEHKRSYFLIMINYRHASWRKIRLWMLLLCISSIESLWATEKGITSLTVSLNDGTSTTYTLGEDAKITFDKVNMYFTSREWKFEVPLNELANWTYSSNSSVNDISETDISITQVNDLLTISGIPSGCAIDIYTINGQHIFSVKNASERENILTNGWQNGAYIIKIANQSFKIVKL